MVMSDKEVTEKKDATERRVYNLPADLLERLRAYQTSQGITSEAEAARRLLDLALQMRDTVMDILNTLEAKFAEEKDLRVLASEIVMKHALVETVTVKEGEIIFQLTNGERGRITHAGIMFYSNTAFGDDWTLYRGKTRKLAPVATTQQLWETAKADLDDEIPF